MKFFQIELDVDGYYIYKGGGKFYLPGLESNSNLRPKNLVADWIAASVIDLDPLFLLILKSEGGLVATWFLEDSMQIISNKLTFNIPNRYIEIFASFVCDAIFQPIWPKTSFEHQQRLIVLNSLCFDEKCFLAEYISCNIQIVRLSHQLPANFTYLYGAPPDVNINYDEVSIKAFDSTAIKNMFFDETILFNAARSGEIVVNDPLSGEIVSSSVSLVLNMTTQAYPLSSSAGECILIAHGGPFVMIRAVYIPSSGVIICTSREVFFPDDIAKVSIQLLLRQLLDSSLDLTSYVTTPREETAQVLMLSHIGHHLWNELPAVEQFILDEQLSTKKRKVIYVVNEETTELFGKIDDLFDKSPILVTRISELELSSFIYKNQSFLVRPTTLKVPMSLRERVLSYAKRVEADFHLKLVNLKDSQRKIILVSPRFDNRIWKNLLEEFILTINDLLKLTPDLVIVIDGYNKHRSSDPISSYVDNIMTKEREFAESIASTFSGKVEVIFNIGESVQKSIIVAEHASLFIAAWGAALSKYKWAARSIGIVASNEYSIQHKRDMCIYQDDRFVDNPSRDTYFDIKDIITDSVELWDLAARDRANFVTSPGTLSKIVIKALNIG